MNTTHFPVIVVALFSSWILTAHADVSERFGGSSNLSVVTSPKSVTAWRTVGSFTPASSIADFTNRFSKAGVGIPVSSNLVPQLTKILLDERSYMPPEWRDNCIKTPDLVLTFSDGRKDLDLFFCLDCQVMLVRTGVGHETKYSLFAGGVPRKILRIMKQIFQKDETIQALRED